MHDEVARHDHVGIRDFSRFEAIFQRILTVNKPAVEKIDAQGSYRELLRIAGEREANHAQQQKGAHHAMGLAESPASSNWGTCAKVYFPSVGFSVNTKIISKRSGGQVVGTLSGPRRKFTIGAIFSCCQAMGTDPSQDCAAWASALSSPLLKLRL